MRVSSIVGVFALAASTQAITVPGTSDVSEAFSSVKRGVSGLFKKQASCPAVWKTISDDELTPIFRSFLNCTDLALQAIRLAFHDCFAGAGCDGSLINAEEWRQPQNQGLETISKKLKAIAEKHNVGKADMIQFAGSHAIITCPLGVVGKTWVGRTDSSIQAPGTDLPDHTAPAQSLLDKFVAKGFTATDLAALLGAHSTARQRFVDPSKAGAAFDATPGQWDVTYYGQVTTQTANFNLDSDLAISRLPSVLPSWTLFTVDQVGWSLAFVAAWQKLTVLGIPGGTSSLIDCTNSLPLVRILPKRGAENKEKSSVFGRFAVKNWW